MRLPRTATAAAAWLYLWVSAAGASPRLEPLPIEAALSEKELGLYSAVRLSPDGRRVAYTVCNPRRVAAENDPRFARHTRTGVWRFGLGCDVWVSATDTGAATNLTGEKDSNWAPRWSPDGRTLAFYSDRAGSAALWVWSAESGIRQVSPAIARPWGISQIEWLSDGRSVVVPLLPEGMTLEQAADLAAPPPRSAGSAPAGVTVKVFRHRPSDPPKEETGPWSIELMRADLAVVDVGTGSTRRILAGEKPAGFWVSPDGTTLAASLNRGFAEAQSQQNVYDIVAVPIGGGSRITLTPRAPLAALGLSAAWAPDSKGFAYLTTDDGVFLASRASSAPRRLNAKDLVFTLGEEWYPFFDSEGKHVLVLSGDTVWKVPVAPGREAVPLRAADRKIKLLLPGGKPGVVLVVTRRDATKDEGLLEVALEDGAIRPIWEGPRSAGRNPAFRVSANSRAIAFTAQDSAHSEDIFLYDRAAGRERRLTAINSTFDDYVMGRARLIEWTSAEGKTLRGALLLPAGYQEGRRYPTVVFIYNGADLSDSVHSFGLRGYYGGADNFQLLATRGYAVLLPDSPSDLKEQMRDIPKNILPGVDAAVAAGVADPDRLGVMGHSNGGYSTLALLTLTPRFRAAVMRAGLGNLVSFYGELGPGGETYGVGVAEFAMGLGNPWTNRQRFIENSPIFFLDRVETPLLIVHGTNDDAVAAFLADEVFVGLRRLGKEVEYARYDGEGHDIEGYPNKVDYVTRMLAWFDEHLKGAGSPPPDPGGKR